MCLGKSYNNSSDFRNARVCFKRAKDGYEDTLGPESEKALEASYRLLVSTSLKIDEKICRYSNIVVRMESSLGEDNVVLLETLDSLGSSYFQNGDLESARKTYERCLEKQERSLNENHPHVLRTVDCLNVIYSKLEYIERSRSWSYCCSNGCCGGGGCDGFYC